MKNEHEDKQMSEYIEFITGSETSLPNHLNNNVIKQVRGIINPSPWLVLFRLSLVVFTVGILNLFLCPQFGIGFIRESGLHEFFMQFGRYTCKFACGVFFLGSGLLLASFTLSFDDLKVLRKHKFLQISALSSFILVLFIAAGGAVYFIFAFYWLMGAIVGGLACMETGYFLRRFYISHFKYSSI